MNDHSQVRTGILWLIVVVALMFYLGCSGGGGGGGDNTDNENIPPLEKMTFQDTYDIDIEDRRETILSTLGTPDTFRIEVSEIEGRTVVSEEWSFINLGVRLDIVDGEVTYVIPIDSDELELALFPRFYNPNEFEFPMDKIEAMAILEGQTLKEQDLADGGFAGMEIVAGDQIVLGFDGDQLVYVETFALIPDTEGEMDNLFIDDYAAETGPEAFRGHDGQYRIKSDRQRRG